MGLRRRRETTRLERAVVARASGELKDTMQRLVNSMGQATRLFEESGDAAALDVVVDNAESVLVIARELASRPGLTAYTPAPDPHLEDLLRKFQAGARRA